MVGSRVDFGMEFFRDAESIPILGLIKKKSKFWENPDNLEKIPFGKSRGYTGYFYPRIGIFVGWNNPALKMFPKMKLK